ncbi:hypothetical protein [Lacrimispora sp.]|uniref:hypothetical protein n=1 Tax=Lacrimispora sp. TaxID=2719234 RepID=UPI0039952A27
MARREKKGRPTSIRLFPETERYLMRCPGRSLTDKFEYLVTFCMKREEMLAKVEEDYQKRFEAFEEELKRKEKLLYKLQETIKDLIAEIEKEKGR